MKHEMLLLKILRKHFQYGNNFPLLKNVLAYYDIATLRRLATYSFGRRVQSAARLVLSQMGHDSWNEEYDDVRFDT